MTWFLIVVENSRVPGARPLDTLGDTCFILQLATVFLLRMPNNGVATSESLQASNLQLAWLTEAAPKPSNNHSARPQSMQRKIRVLVVDDNQSVADTARLVLVDRGYEAEVAYSGEDALDLARSAHFDILVTDVMMEPMNGIQTAIAFRHINPQGRVVLMSGNERAANLLLDAVRTGHEFPVLAKPFHPQELFSEISAISVPPLL